MLNQTDQFQDFGIKVTSKDMTKFYQQKVPGITTSFIPIQVQQRNSMKERY